MATTMTTSRWTRTVWTGLRRHHYRLCQVR
jgi:hypothetical protein